jgi:hypothetical protein
MTNDLKEKPKNLPAMYETEANNILEAAQEDSGFEKLLKFKKGKYFIGDYEVPLGSEYVAHASQWTKCWIKFAGGKVADRKMGKVAEGYVPPEREVLGDNDQSKWELGLDNNPKDPWSLQYLLPLENPENGDIVVFTTSSIGGRRGVSDLCKAYGRHAKKGSRALPIIKLSATDMPSKKWGDVPRPEFEITNWDDADHDLVIRDIADDGEVIPPAADDMDDEIPF